MKQDHIQFNDGSTIFKIMFKSILYVKVVEHYCHLYTHEMFYTIRCTLNEFLEGPAGAYFLQVHRSHAVNIDYITGMSRREVFLGNRKLKMGRSFAKYLLLAYKK
ncbi:LytTR family transcriptional regulator [Flavihumibacter sediminis]|nr:LytTR family transcriptional regulator [Flavihumibacter sediminis]